MDERDREEKRNRVNYLQEDDPPWEYEPLDDWEEEKDVSLNMNGNEKPSVQVEEIVVSREGKRSRVGAGRKTGTGKRVRVWGVGV